MSEARESGPQYTDKGSKIESAFKKAWGMVIKTKEGQADLTALPIFGPTIVEFDNKIAEKGLALAVKESSQKLGINIVPEYTNDTLETLGAEPVLLVATHPQIVDVAGVIGALPTERRDIFLLGNSAYLGAGKNAIEHLIPIYGVAYQQTRNLRSRLWRKTGFEAPPPSPMRAARLNVESLRIASQRIKEGSLVLVFPDGSKEEGGEWFNGVGELVRSLRGSSATKVVFASVTGSKSRDKFRFFPKGAQLLGQTQMVVKFSDPHSINEYLTDQSTKQSITQQLRNQYEVFSTN